MLSGFRLRAGLQQGPRVGPHFLLKGLGALVSHISSKRGTLVLTGFLLGLPQALGLMRAVRV